MTNLAEELWLHLRTHLEEFAKKVTMADSSLIYNIGKTTNKAFLLRGYLSLMKRSDGNEVAITVDVQTDDDLLSVVSDVCTDDGVIIAVGPSVSIPSSGNQINIKAALDEWLDEFGRFLQESEPTVVTSVSELL